MPRPAWAPERRDIIWIDCNSQTGREMKDVQPMLVLSPRAFNERTGLVIGLPMMTASYNETNPFAVEFHGPKHAVCYILTHQPKSFEWRARGGKPTRGNRRQKAPSPPPANNSNKSSL